MTYIMKHLYIPRLKKIDKIIVDIITFLKETPPPLISKFKVPSR